MSIPMGILPVTDPRETEATQLYGHTLGVLSRAAGAPRSETDAESPIFLTVNLAYSDRAGLERYVAALKSMQPSAARPSLSQEEFTARFGPTKPAYEAVLNYLLS